MNYDCNVVYIELENQYVVFSKPLPPLEIPSHFISQLPKYVRLSLFNFWNIEIRCTHKLLRVDVVIASIAGGKGTLFLAPLQ
jgi:hypothetical protein